MIIVWFGLGLTSKVVNAALVAFFPLMVNTIVGLRSAEEDRINLMRSLAATPLQIFWMLQLPNALPYIFAGLEIAMIFALIGAIVAEFVGAQAGLGMLIQSMNFSMDVAGQFSVLLILSILGLDPQQHHRRHPPPRAVLGRAREGGSATNGNNGRRHMKKIAIAIALIGALGAGAAQAQTTVKVGWCARTISSAVAPFAIATKMGWFAQAGFKVEIVPLPGSTDCVKTVATRDVQYSLAVDRAAGDHPAAGRQGEELSTPPIRATSTASPSRKAARSRASRTSRARRSA